jgi:pSer/pThr/pTyr-binding forkhead associated (FHA) protein
MLVVLSIFVGKKERGSFSIVRDVTTIGRSRDCDVRIAVSQVSRQHCQLVRDGDELRIEDMGSSNGTFHNGKKVDRAVLSPGDRIGVGPVTLVVRIDDLPGHDDAAPDLASDTTDFHADFAVEEGKATPDEEDSFLDFTSDAPPEPSPEKET